VGNPAEAAKEVAVKEGHLAEGIARAVPPAGAPASAGPAGPRSFRMSDFTTLFCKPSSLGVNWLAMDRPRGREARLKAEFADLYPGLEPGVWIPVEKLIHVVTELLHDDRARSGVITGDRLLHQEHFEYRGQSARPTGLPEKSTRLSDAGAAPGKDQDEERRE
jgi:hypothetical protein